MGMTKKLWSINALATEFGMDRRTVAKRIEDIPYDGKDRGSPQWHIASVMWALAPDPPRGRASSDSKFDAMSETIACRITNWREIFTPSQSEAGRVSLAEFAELAGEDEKVVLTWLRAGMPYIVRGDFETGAGFVLHFAHSAEWIAFAKRWLWVSERKDLIRALGV